MQRYAQLRNNVVQVVIESHFDPDGVNGQWIACPDNVGPGFTFDGVVFAPPDLTPPPAVADEAEWYIDLGPFNDRFGAKKLTILMSTDPVIMAFNSDKNSRHWIDLKRQDVIAAISYMAGVPLPGLPTISTPILTAQEVQDVLTAPVQPAEQFVLRKNYFPKKS